MWCLINYDKNRPHCSVIETILYYSLHSPSVWAFSTHYWHCWTKLSPRTGIPMMMLELSARSSSDLGSSAQVLNIIHCMYICMHVCMYVFFNFLSILYVRSLRRTAFPTRNICITYISFFVRVWIFMRGFIWKFSSLRTCWIIINIRNCWLRDEEDEGIPHYFTHWDIAMLRIVDIFRCDALRE